MMESQYFTIMVRYKSNREATFTQILIIGIATAVLGICIGFLHEARISPQFSGVPVSRENFQKSLDERKVVFHHGRNLPVSDTETKLRNITMNSGASPFRFLEGDLNLVANRYFNFSGALAGKEDSNGGWARIHPNTPNFHLNSGALQISTELDFALLGFSANPWLVIRGVFSTEMSSRQFTVQEAWINSARIPNVLGQLLLNRIAKSYLLADPDSPVNTIWNHITSLSLEEKELVVHTR